MTMKPRKQVFMAIIFTLICQSAFSQENTSSSQKWGRNIISINYLHILNGNSHLGYERLTKNGLLGLKFSVNFNLGETTQSGLLKYKRNFTTGFDLNFYPTGQGRIKYFAGPSFRVGAVSGETVIYDDFRRFTRYAYNNRLNTLGVFFNNGFVIQTTPKLYMGVQGAIGVSLFQKGADATSRYSEVDGFVALNMGYRF